MAKEVTNVELKGEIETEIIDVKKYVGKKAKISSFKVMENDIDGKQSYYLNVKTEAIDVTKEGKDITASRNFSLKFDTVNGGVGWASAGNLANFLNEHAIKDYKEIIDKEVVVLTTDADKNGQKWLTF